MRDRQFLAEALLRAGHQEKGVEILQLKRTRNSGDPLAMAQSLASIAERYLDAGTLADAEPCLRKTLDLLQANAIPGHWRQFATKSALGSSLAEQGKYEEAENLLLSGGRGLLAEKITSAYLPQRKVTRKSQERYGASLDSLN